MVRRGEPLSKIERGQPRWGGLLIVRLAGSPRVPGRHRPSRRDVRLFRVGGSLDLGDRPAEPGELAGRGDRDDRPSLPTGFEACPGAVQPLLRRPGDRDRFLGLAGLAFGQAFAEVRSRAVMPCCLDKQPPARARTRSW